MSDVDTLRRFNRSYTQRIGVLAESYLDTGRPLGPSRLLFEIGSRGGARVADLRRSLALDSGYLSRLLRSLEADGLVTVTPDRDDRRQRVVRLTRAGHTAWRRLEQRSEALAQRLVAPLTPGQRQRLDDALATADALLRAATITFERIAADHPDARWALGEYFAELDRRFPTGFDPGPHDGKEARSYRPPHGAFVLVRSDGDVVACGAVQRIDDDTAEIKRMWVHPSWRGLGVGRRLVEHLEQTARDLGRTSVLLDTNGTLTEAIAMYRSLGYRAVGRYNDNPYAQHWFAKTL